MTADGIDHEAWRVVDGGRLTKLFGVEPLVLVLRVAGT